MPVCTRQTSDQHERWIKPVQRGTGDPTNRLICFAHAGGSARSFRPWRKVFPDSLDIYAVQLPGREERAAEGFLDNIHQAAEIIGETIRPLVQSGAALFGHSLGGLIAFETVRWLEAREQITPMHLFVSACEVPTYTVEKPLHREPDAVLIDEVLAIGRTPPEVFEHTELREAMLPVLRNDYRLRETYRCRPGAMLRCPVTVCSGRVDATVDSSALAQWQDLCAGPFYRKCFNGGHFYIVDELPALAHFICERLQIRFEPTDPELGTLTVEWL